MGRESTPPNGPHDTRSMTTPFSVSFERLPGDGSEPDKIKRPNAINRQDSLTSTEADPTVEPR